MLFKVIYGKRVDEFEFDIFEDAGCSSSEPAVDEPRKGSEQKLEALARKLFAMYKSDAFDLFVFSIEFTVMYCKATYDFNYLKYNISQIFQCITTQCKQRNRPNVCEIIVIQKDAGLERQKQFKRDLESGKYNQLRGFKFS